MPIKQTRERLALLMIAQQIADSDFPHAVLMGDGRGTGTVTVGDVIKDALDMPEVPWEKNYDRKGVWLSDDQWVQIERRFGV